MSLRLSAHRLLLNGNNFAIKNMNLIQRRRQSVIAGPPLNPLSDLECLIYGGGMCVSLLALPIYTLLHLREYGGNK